MTTDTEAAWRFVDVQDLIEDTVGFDQLDVRSSTTDEVLGTVRGFIVDGATRQLHYIVIDSGGWFSTARYLFPPAYTRADAEQRVLWAETTRAAIRRFPAFDPGQYPHISADQLWGIERSIIEAYGDDPGVVAPSVDWDRDSWAPYRQPEWWRPDFVSARETQPKPEEGAVPASRTDRSQGGGAEPTGR